jgi:GTPase SAR1 family protein
MGQKVSGTILFLGSSGMFLTKNNNFLFLGAGKTSIIKYCENNYKPVSGDPPKPSVGHSISYIKGGSIEFTAWDVSGASKFQDLWSKYYKEVDGVVWVIDSTNDENELEEVKELLNAALQSNDLR